jgi:hypothetical protein
VTTTIAGAPPELIDAAWVNASIYKFSSECGDKPPLRAQP